MMSFFKCNLVCFLLISATLTAVQAQLIAGNFVDAGYTRAYDTYLPTGWSPGANMPVVLDLHYLGADGRDEDSLSRFQSIADTGGFIVCYPYGLGTDWLVGQTNPYLTGLGDVAFIDHLIDTLHARYGIDLQRVYATGMGQGGFMAFHLACQLGHRVAAIASVGASIADSAAFYCQGTRPVPTLIIHGTADSVVPYATGLPGVWRSIPSLVDFWRQRNVCSSIEVTQQLPDLVQEGSTITIHTWDCNNGSIVQHYEVINGGFAWPGANRDLGSGGLRNMDINASAHIWNFFNLFDINGLVHVDASHAGSESLLQIHPNPVSDRLHIAMSKGRLGQVTLRDLQGQSVYMARPLLGTQELDIDVSGLPVSLYLLTVGTVTHRVAVVH